MEDTKVEDNTAIIEQMLRDAEKAEEPSEMARNPVIHKGDEDVPVPMIGKVTSAGYVTVYDTKTGVPSKVNNNMIRSMLKKKRADGSPVFGIRQTVKPVVGTFNCLLHQSDPNREHYDAIGLAVCPKGNLASIYQVRRHMLKKHKVEWDAIEQERTDKEKQEDRDFQRLLLSRATEAPLYISAKDKKK